LFGAKVNKKDEKQTKQQKKAFPKMEKAMQCV